MMSFLLPALAVLVTGGIALRLWYRRWRQAKIESNRRVEAPNSHYSSTGVQNQVDRERWGGIQMNVLHPLNQEEVMRLLEVVDEDGVKSLSRRDRLFLDNMTLPRMGVCPASRMAGRCRPWHREPLPSASRSGDRAVAGAAGHVIRPGGAD